MNEKLERQNPNKKRGYAAKECAFVAVFVALVIAAQLVLSFLPGVEVVTVLFVSYAFVMGWKRGVIAACVFSLLRQIVFGIFPVVLILYLIYYTLLALCFGALGKRIKRTTKFLPLLVAIACVGTVGFTMLDNLLTPLWYGYGAKAARLYFYSSLPFMIPHVICTAVSVACLFLPLTFVFRKVRSMLERG